MKLCFKSWLENSIAPNMSGATTTASVANYTMPLFGSVIRKDLNEVIPRKRRRRRSLGR